MRKKKLSNEEIKNIVVAAETAIIASLPDPKDCEFEFSPEFEEKMRKLIEGTGDKKIEK